MDIDTLEPGVDFVAVVERTLSECDVLLAIIGPRWLSASDRAGTRRLERQDDFVRLEVEAALSRNIRTIPVLVQSAEMPSAEKLPDAMAPLTRRQAIELTDVRWAYDVGRLVDTLKKIQGYTAPPQPPGIKPSSPPEAPTKSSSGDAPMPSAVEPASGLPSAVGMAAVIDVPAIRVDDSEPAAFVGQRTFQRGGIAVLLLSVAFGLLSAVYGAESADISSETYEQFLGRVHSVVRPVSLVYFAACLAFFSLVAWKGTSPRTWMPLLAIPVCLVMFIWTTMLSGAISFNEVFVAWVGAAIMLGMLGWLSTSESR